MMIAFSFLGELTLLEKQIHIVHAVVAKSDAQREYCFIFTTSLMEPSKCVENI